MDRPDISNRSSELLILGQGPAALAAAIRAAQLEIQVIVLGRPPSSNLRPGETLAPGTYPLLVQLGLADLVNQFHLPSPGIASAWEFDEFHEQDFLFNPYGNGWHLDRELFDQQLVDMAIELGITVVSCDRLIDLTRSASPDSWTVTVQIDGRRSSFSSLCVFDATGRSAWLSHRLDNQQIKHDRLLGIVGFLDQAPDTDGRTYLEAMEGGWWYFANLPGNRSVAAYMTDSDLVPTRGGFKQLWRQRLAESRRGRLLKKVLEQSNPTFRVAPANTRRLESFVGNGWAAIGDAAASWDPLSSQGINTALESGIRVVDEWHAHRQSEKDDPVILSRYSNWLEEAWSDYLLAHQHYYSQVQRWPDSLFWQRRRKRTGDDYSSLVGTRQSIRSTRFVDPVV